MAGGSALQRGWGVAQKSDIWALGSYRLLQATGSLHKRTQSVVASRVAHPAPQPVSNPIFRQMCEQVLDSSLSPWLSRPFDRASDTLYSHVPRTYTTVLNEYSTSTRLVLDYDLRLVHQSLPIVDDRRRFVLRMYYLLIPGDRRKRQDEGPNASATLGDWGIAGILMFSGDAAWIGPSFANCFQYCCSFCLPSSPSFQLAVPIHVFGLRLRDRPFRLRFALVPQDPH